MCKKKKIGILFDRINAGEAKFAYNQAKYFKKFGADVTVFIIKRDEKTERFLKLPLGTKLVYFSDFVPFLFGVKFPYFHFFSGFHLTAPLILPFYFPRQDVILSVNTYTCLTAMSLKIFRKIPYVALLHDPISYILPRVYSRTPLSLFFWCLRPRAYYFDKIICALAKSIITGSRLHLDFFREIAPNKKVAVVFPGCNPQKSIPGQRGDYILFVSRWETGKKPERIISLAQRLENYKIVIAGRWTPEKLKKDFEITIKNLGLKDRISLTGFISERKLTGLFKKARCWTHTIVEDFGMGGLEAASCGCPVIMTKNSGVIEAVPNAASFPEGDINKWLQELKPYLEDERFAWEEGRKAWQYSQRCTWENHSLKIYDFLTNDLQ